MDLPKDTLASAGYECDILFSTKIQGCETRTPTFSINPEKRIWTGRFPCCESVALDEPCGRSSVMGFLSGVVIFPWVWRGKPLSSLFLQLVAYDGPQCSLLET